MKAEVEKKSGPCFVHCEVYIRNLFSVHTNLFQFHGTGAGEQLCLVNASEAGSTKQLHAWTFPS